MLLKDITLGAKINFVVSGITTMELMGIINVGAVTLSVEGREFVLDSYYTDFNDVAGDKPMVEVRCRLEVDEETFEDGYTLTCADLLSSNLKATFYFYIVVRKSVTRSYCHFVLINLKGFISKKFSINGFYLMHQINIQFCAKVLYAINFYYHLHKIYHC